MKLRPAAAFALALWAGWLSTANAASIDYALSIPLLAVAAEDPTLPTLLRGTLSYDQDEMTGVGTFSLTGAGDPISGVFSGLSFLMPVDGGATGLLFDGTTEAGAQLFINIVASSDPATATSGAVSYFSVGCLTFDAIGATLSPADLPPVSLPGTGSDPDPIFSPVPLPPAVSLLGAALAGLGGLGVLRRRRKPALRVA